MPASPATFDGTLQSLIDDCTEQIMPSAEIVGDYHRLLVNYCRLDDPLFLIRNMGGTERGTIYSTKSGARFKATDNAPAWWMHYALFHEIRISQAEFPQVVETIPCHMFEVSAQLPESINTAGWHVAHIVDVKDRNVHFPSWDRTELTRRFLRNVHPCNYFFLPKPQWQKWGADARVIGFFAALYADRYSSVWQEFLELSGADMSKLPRTTGQISYRYGTAERAAEPTERHPNGSLLPTRAIGAGGGATDAPVVSYSASRLLFKADLIDPLRDEDKFRVTTPAKTYEMSKADFLRVFARVTLTNSWRRDRVYHYPRPPAAAAQFLISSGENRDQ